LEVFLVPKPPILPLLNWKKLFESGLQYDAWLHSGENSDNGAKMESARASLKLEPTLEAFLGALPRPVHVVAIAEDWCGDVVRHVPALQRLADAGPNLRVRYVSRGQSPEMFVRFLTNGGEAIPKFIFLNDVFVECGNWGPMPEACRELIARGKACGDPTTARQRVSALYQEDPELRVVISELVRLVDIASTAGM
jgi:hypothetical protein